MQTRSRIRMRNSTTICTRGNAQTQNSAHIYKRSRMRRRNSACMHTRTRKRTRKNATIRTLTIRIDPQIEPYRMSGNYGHTCCKYDINCPKEPPVHCKDFVRRSVIEESCYRSDRHGGRYTALSLWSRNKERTNTTLVGTVRSLKTKPYTHSI